MKTAFQLARSLTAFVLVFSYASLRAAEFFEITAEIDVFGYALNDTNSVAKAKPRTLGVKCITGAAGWYLEYQGTQPMAWSFDGTNVVCREGQQIETWKSRDGHPMGDFNVNLPWLAFCSGTFLQREGRMIPLPAAVLRHCPDRFAYDDVTTTFNDPMGLPRSIDLFTSKARFLKSHTDWDKEHAFGDRYTAANEQRAASLQEGVLVFHYAVLESTNVLGRNFPAKFEFFQSGRKYEQMGNWFCQGTGRIKTIGRADKFPVLK